MVASLQRPTWRSVSIDFFDEPRRRGRGDVGVEAVPGQKGVGPPATAAGIGLASERPGVAAEEPLRGGEVDVAVFRRSDAGRLASLVEKLVDDGPVDALERELALERDLAPRPSPVARLDPRPSECRVVEHAELGQAFDGGIDKVGSIPDLAQPPTDLGDRPGADLEEPGSRLKNDGRIIDGTPLLASLSRRSSLVPGASTRPAA